VTCLKQLAQAWQQLLSKNGDAAVEVNMYKWAERLTMECIGQSEIVILDVIYMQTKHRISGIWGAVWCH